MDRDHLASVLADEFGGDEATRRAVARQAGDLADSGRLAADAGIDLDAAAICRHLADAPEGYSLAERWNWWIGSLELAFGGYDRFLVRSGEE